MQDTVSLIREAVQSGSFLQYGDLNVATIVNMRDDPNLSRFFRRCKIVNIDGMGVLFAARLLGAKVSERVAGVDLFHALLDMATRCAFGVYLLGGKPDVIRATIESVTASHEGLKISGFHHGYFWDDEEAIVKDIQESGAKLLFVGISSPSKEYFIDHWGETLGVLFVMGVGGTFDVVSGKVRRAPLWMQKIGFEWLFRLLQEPRRLWRRYLVTNMRFALMVLRALLAHSWSREPRTRDG